MLLLLSNGQIKLFHIPLQIRNLNEEQEMQLMLAQIGPSLGPILNPNGI